MARVIDEWDPLVVTVKDIKSEVGIDVEDGGDKKKQPLITLNQNFMTNQPFMTSKIQYIRRL